ncbi:MAG: excinuclease ABC subunit UvrC [Deltaproteobacteria bacterium]|nr:excinuclease ABC subunit UvrC [Deltaproteobacteria bacterium]
MNSKPSQQLADLPSQPGVYLMKDKSGKVLYVGKARDLKKRVSSYFKDAGVKDLKTEVLVGKIDHFDTIITGSEKEAILLESNLIKRYRPRYNVILRDDKNYPSLRLDINNPFPRLSIVRKFKKDGALYFGPFASAHAVRETLKLIYRTFKIRRCKSIKVQPRTRPCINYEMGTCSGACAGLISQEDYRRGVNDLILFLKGRSRAVIEDLKIRMMKAAETHNFEAAAALRDKMFALEKTLEKQVMVIPDFKDRDILGITRSNAMAVVTVLFVRGGRLLGSYDFFFKNIQVGVSEVIESFLKQYYGKDRFVPDEIFLPAFLEETALLEKWLSGEKGRKVSILMPQRGEKKRLVRMACRNSQHAIETRAAAASDEISFLERLRRHLRLSHVPERIECFDLSSLAGSEPVGAMVVFDGMNPNKSAYRKFRIKSAEGLDDYGMLYEVMNRRYSKGDAEEQFPDLLMVDGGKGQLSVAVNVLKELGLYGRFDLLSIAKRDKDRGETEDKIFKPGRKNPVTFGKARDLLLFLQRVRDEAHRFVISYHRKRRAMGYKRSVLDTIPGVGKKRKHLLLRHMGSLGQIKKATVKDLLKTPGINRKVAEEIVRVFAERSF